jgi:hypothetical protein
LFSTVTPAHADELPARKAGLWEMKMTLPTGQEQTTRQCTDPSTEKAMQNMALAGGIMTCSKLDIRKTAGGYTVDAVCSMSSPMAMTTTSHTEYTGDFSSAYTMKQTGRVEMDKMPPQNTNTTIQAKWQGACPSGWKPGDTELPGGRRMNLLTAAANATAGGKP